MIMMITMKSSACFLALPYLLVLQAWLSGLLHPGYRACTKDNFLQLPSVPMTYLSNVVIIMVMVMVVPIAIVIVIVIRVKQLYHWHVAGLLSLLAKALNLPMAPLKD